MGSCLQVVVLIVEAATFAGLIILLVQFANIMTTVSMVYSNKASSALGCTKTQGRLCQGPNQLASLAGTWCCLQDGSTRRFHSTTVYNWNVGVGSTCLALLTGMLIVYVWRVASACQQHKVW